MFVAYAQPQSDPPFRGGNALTDDRRPRAPQAYYTLAGLLEKLRQEIDDLAEVLAGERDATYVEADDIVKAWKMVMSSNRGTGGGRWR